MYKGGKASNTAGAWRAWLPGGDREFQPLPTQQSWHTASTKVDLAFLPINLLQKPNGVIYPLIFYQKGGAGLNICIEEGILIVSPLKWITGSQVLTISLCQEVLSKRWGYCLQLIWNMNNIQRHSVCIIIGNILNINPFRWQSIMVATIQQLQKESKWQGGWVWLILAFYFWAVGKPQNQKYM